MYLTGILERCSDIENRMARVYRALAERVGASDAARVWRELALEDETHADILRRELRSLEEGDDSDSFMPEYADRLERADRILRDLEERARTLTTIDEATAVVLAREQATLEDLYDDLVVKAPTDFKLLSERIEAALANAPAGSIPGLPNSRGSRSTGH
jgi:rubrerythrin